jgi:hypothetical protein
VNDCNQSTADVAVFSLYRDITMTSRRPHLRRLLRYSPIPIALTITATLFSGNTINLLNDWDWFNGSFNPHPHDDEASSRSDSPPLPLPPPAINIQVDPAITVDPVITLDPADITFTWPPSSPSNDLDLNLENHLAPSIGLEAPAPIEITLPDIGVNADTDVKQWVQPQSRTYAPDGGNFSTFRWYSPRMFTTAVDTGSSEVLMPAFSPASAGTASEFHSPVDENTVLTAIALESPALLQNYGLSTRGLPPLPPGSPALVAIAEPQVLLGLGLVGAAIGLTKPRGSD